MPGVTIAILANIVAASPSVPPPWVRLDDYPLDALAKRSEGMSEFELVVGPNGRPLSCTIVRSTGNRQFDRSACAAAMRSARFSPARDNALQPAFGTYRSRVEWRSDMNAWNQVGPSAVKFLTLSRMPRGENSPMFREYAVEVDATGKAVRCAPAFEGLPELANATCATLIAELPAMPVAVPSGNVGAIRSLWVAYSL